MRFMVDGMDVSSDKMHCLFKKSRSCANVRLQHILLYPYVRYSNKSAQG